MVWYYIYYPIYFKKIYIERVGTSEVYFLLSYFVYF